MSDDDLSLDSEEPDHKRELNVAPKGILNLEDDDLIMNNEHDDFQFSDGENTLGPEATWRPEKESEPKPPKENKEEEKNQTDSSTTTYKKETSTNYDDIFSKAPKKSKQEQNQEEVRAQTLVEATADSLLKEMANAFDKDYQNSMRKQPSFERLRFLQTKLEPLCHDRSLTRELIKQGILDRIKDWFKGFGKGVPIITNTELLLKVLMAYDLTKDDIKESGIVEAVSSVNLSTDTQAYKIKSNLISTWKRIFVDAKSGFEHQKSTYFKPGMDESSYESAARFAYHDSEERKRRDRIKKRDRLLKQRGYEIEEARDLNTKSSRIFRSVTSIRKH